MQFAYFAKKLQDVHIRDFMALFPMTLGILISPFRRKRYRHTWLIGEADNEARDNGYYFYRYMRTVHPEQETFYFISPRQPDAKKVMELGPIVRQGSIRHWVMYFTCEWIISSQKGGKPNAAICAFFELKGYFKPRFVFLQHGVTKEKPSWLMADRCHFEYVITATKSETDFMKTAFGYPEGIIQYTGFPRFDQLHEDITVPNRILIMPTWRTWLRNKSSRGETGETNLKSSRFLKKWLCLLNSSELEHLAKDYDLEIIFYPHRQLQREIKYFRITNPYVKIMSETEMDIQYALRTAALMITDWSSVFFDMYYMKKPVIFYQFDEKDFRAHHYAQGWFDYHDNPFSLSFETPEEVLTRLELEIKNGFHVSKTFEVAHAQEFLLYDTNNCERVYKLLKE